MQRFIQEYRNCVNPYWVGALEALDHCPVFNEAKGSYLTDDKGDTWLDFVMGYGSALLGHNPQEIRANFLEDICKDLPIITPFGIAPGSAALCSKVIEKSALHNHQCWIMTTGAEAIECAVKVAQVSTQRSNLLCNRTGFHGLSIHNVNLTGNAHWRQGLPNFVCDHIDYTHCGNLALTLEKISTRKFAAYVTEPIEGMGGGQYWSAEQIEKIKSACEQAGTRLIVDEVMTGVWRTGRFLASQSLNWSIEPDHLVLSKNLTAGFSPLSILLSSSSEYRHFFGRAGFEKAHGSTFCGNSIAVSSALSLMTYMEEHDVLSKGLTTHHYLAEKLKALKKTYPHMIESTASFGALHYISVKGADSDVLAYYLFNFLFCNRVLVNMCANCPNTLKLTPPLTLTLEHVDTFLSLFESALEALVETFPHT
ncbi:aminotransferase class III-fold pyridoxal phosphate-dependent enzyme [Enterovibrio sp. ZSDZ42]|uniref:Aminotransferase class III-fold pyridoxal phosphate-dependent enzyme n=1 Tax=Enterovibrio gelatinilyticus TaxID=2899819 RepID=A0ABT5QUN9_9GAMM|nr:aminotransferase class III-fold pyridoxal phosphate-dependent enzyme [Enterovibrio sp. ZSDZ42]MDD1791722.1 aminotransferase class III-fold pyridoxal phosphate-dependent enzyme [Enterovibrio sp. ZSDZ42]